MCNTLLPFVCALPACMKGKQINNKEENYWRYLGRVHEKEDWEFRVQIKWGEVRWGKIVVLRWPWHGSLYQSPIKTIKRMQWANGTSSSSFLFKLFSI